MEAVRCRSCGREVAKRTEWPDGQQPAGLQVSCLCRYCSRPAYVPVESGA